MRSARKFTKPASGHGSEGTRRKIYDGGPAVIERRAAYLERGKTYLIYHLDADFRSVRETVVQRHEIPDAVAAKCDRYQPHDFREVRIPQ